jgi:ABC-2 type transport system permease protein
MKNIRAVFLKQLSDTLKNKPVLIQFVLMPSIAVLLENTIKADDMPDRFFMKMFAVMFVGMAPLSCMSSLISEEKEKNTLRVLLMSNVRPAEYLIGIGSYVFVMCLGGTAVFAALGGYTGVHLAEFLIVMFLGIILSELTGAVIGVFSKNQMTAASLTVPVIMIFSFLPMIANFNKTVRTAAKVTYSQQISELINGIGTTSISAESLIVIVLNLTLAVFLFIAAYKRKGLE